MARRSTTPTPKAEAEVRWAGIAEAATETGLSVASVRAYAARDHVRTRTGIGPRGERTEVAVEDVIARRRKTGGEYDGRADSAAVAQGVGDLRGQLAEARERAAVAEALVPEPGAAVVPLEQWRAVMGQLANLHEAGRDLAEARERAGKAETEAAFLRERLAELRATQDQTEAAPRRRLFRRG